MIASKLAAFSLVLSATFLYPNQLPGMETIDVRDFERRINITPRVEYYVDGSANLSAEDISNGKTDTQFQRADVKRLNFGLIPDPIWIRFDLDLGAGGRNIVLELDDEVIQYIDLFLLDREEDATLVSSTGKLRSRSSEDLAGTTYAWDVTPFNGRSAFLIRVQSFAPKAFPLYVWHKEAFLEKESHKRSVLFALAGFLGALFGYHVILGVLLRSGDYVLLGIMSGLFAMIVLNVYGVLHDSVFTGDGSSLFHIHILLLGAFCFCLTRLSASFAADSKTTRVVFLFFQAFFVAFLPAGLAVRWFSVVTAVGWLAGLSMIGFSIVQSIRAGNTGNRPSTLYAAAFFPVFSLAGVRLLSNLGVVPDSFFARHAVAISFPLTLVLLTAVLSYRFRSITDEADRSKEKLILHLQNANDAKDRFLASTAHELRTPLNGIIGLTDAVVRDGAGLHSATAKDALRTVSNSAWRLSHLVNDILDHSKGKRSEIRLEQKSVNLTQIVRVVIANLAPLIEGKPVELRNTLTPELPNVWADEHRIQQILVNLLGNAIKFTTEGEILVSAIERGSDVVVSVKDEGIGVDERDRQSIFDAYEQGDSVVSGRYGGTGIGLSVTRQLVELHKGRIWIDSEVGKGSVFSFSLPRASKIQRVDALSDRVVVQDDETAISNEPLSGFVNWEIPQDGQYRIIAIDDEPVNLKVIHSYLPRDVYLVHHMTSGMKLMDHLADPSPAELVLLDIFMPDVSGFELCSQIRKGYQPHELPILMLTASNSLEDMTHAFALGANDFITKPVSREELLARVETHVRLKKSIERIELTNRKLNEIDRLISFGFLATTLVLRDHINFDQGNLILRKAYEYHAPLIRDLLVDSSSRSETSLSEDSEPLALLNDLTVEQLKGVIKNVQKSARTYSDAAYSDNDVDRISTDVFDLVSRLLLIKMADPIESAWETLTERYGLTPREIETAKRIWEGYSNQEIANRLGISSNTVKKHVYSLFNKIGVENRTHLIYKIMGQAKA